MARSLINTSSSPEDKNTWNYTSTPQYTFRAWCPVKAKGLYFYRACLISVIYVPITCTVVNARLNHTKDMHEQQTDIKPFYLFRFIYSTLRYRKKIHIQSVLNPEIL
jgi:hypothetical protein